MNLTKTKKALSIFLTLIIAFSACLIIGRLFLSKKRPIFLFRHAVFVVISPSMEPEYPLNSLVLIKKTSFDSLRVGDVIVFEADALGGGLAFHRITRITSDGVFVKGDMNLNEDNQAINSLTLVGKCVGKSVFLGRIITILRTPLGLSLLCLPLLTGFVLKKAVYIKKEKES